VQMDIEKLDFAVLAERDRKRTIDATIGQWNTQPSPGAVLGSWGIAGSRAASGNNFGSYENPVFDANIDSALASFDLPTRKRYFSTAYNTIIQDAPAIWIAEPKQIVGYHGRLQLVALRPDAWWIHIPDWSIPRDKRIARDTLGGESSPAQPAGQKAP
jgi:ABC-type transport system substrate-binding protein